jgi:putative ABC transport system substrate-binding protein
MDRRRFLVTSLAGVLAAPLAAEAQQAGRIARVGYFSPAVPPNPVDTAFEQVLQRHGWFKDQNLTIEYRHSRGRQDTVGRLVAELVDLKVDVLVAWGLHGALAAKRVTSQIPVVFLTAFFFDPVEAGLVSSLARPGRNATGVAVFDLETDAKRLELLKEAVPALRRIALLVSPEQNLISERKGMLAGAAKQLGLEIREIEVNGPAAVEATVRRAKDQGAQALYVWPSGFTFSFGRQISEFSLTNRLPSIHGYQESVVAGGLLSFGPSVPEIARRGAVYVDKILRGARPGDLPVEQPTRFELAISLRTAKALGLTIPPSSLLARADQVIE